MKGKWIILITLVVSLAAGTAGALAFIYSGVYDIAASRPHTRFVRTLLLTVKRRSVQLHARNLKVPDLNDAELIKRGFGLYRRYCVTCHGAPGEGRLRIGIGMNPNPPPLEKAIEEWTAAEIAWITSRGLKMAGMPAFGLGQEPGDIWAITAFVRRMNTLSPAEYRKMLAADRGELAEEEVQWLPVDAGWDTLIERGDAEEGRRLINYHGCGGCHRIPEIPGAQGTAGPPLRNWPERHYIAGALVNNPANFVSWIKNPHAVEPQTAMPNLNLTDDEAWNIASFLYALGQD